MSVSCQLVVPLYNVTEEDVSNVFRELGKAGEIAVVNPGDFPTISFRFVRWKKTSEEKYLELKRFKPVVSPRSKESRAVANQLKEDLLETAEAELLACQLPVSLDIEEGHLYFRTEYPEYMGQRQAGVLAAVLQSKLESLFNRLCMQSPFPSMEYIVR